MKNQFLIPFKGDIVAYITKLQTIQPANLLAIWPGSDTSGSQCTEVVNGWHGTYNGVTLNN